MPLLDDKRFFEGFNTSFFFNKVRALETSISPVASEAALAGDDELQTPDGRAAFVRDIRAEIHFTALHNIETLLYLMLSFYGRKPMFLYMNLEDKIKERAQDLEAGNYSKLSKDGVTEKRAFFQYCLFAGLVVHDDPTFEKLVVDSIDIVEHCVRVYLLGLESFQYRTTCVGRRPRGV